MLPVSLVLYTIYHCLSFKVHTPQLNLWDKSFPGPHVSSKSWWHSALDFWMNLFSSGSFCLAVSIADSMPFSSWRIAPLLQTPHPAFTLLHTLSLPDPPMLSSILLLTDFHLSLMRLSLFSPSIDYTCFCSLPEASHFTEAQHRYKTHMGCQVTVGTLVYGCITLPRSPV